MALNPRQWRSLMLVARFATSAIVIAAFGPYVVGPIRLEQVVTYGLLLLALPIALMSFRPPRWGLAIMGAWLSYMLAACVALAMPPFNRTRWPEGSVVAGLDNLILPVAVMLVVWILVPRSASSDVFDLVVKLVAATACANGILAMIMTRVDLTSVIRPFIAPNDSTRLIADFAMQLGRYSGIFGQPAEAGLVYALGGLAACFGFSKRPLLMYVVLIPIVIGGLVCVSKIFILGGLPLIAWQLWRRRRKVVGPFIAVAAVTATVIGQTAFLADWTGARFLGRLFDVSQTDDLVGLYTADRIGSSSTLEQVIHSIWSNSPIYGFGMGGLRVPYDNGWMEAFTLAGIVGVGCYSITLLIVVLMARSKVGSDTRSYLTGVGLLAIGASIGLPALTANRAGSLLWLVIAVGTVVYRSSESNSDESVAGRPPHLATSPSA